MKSKIAGFTVLAASMVFCAGMSAFGQTIVSVEYTGGYSTTWDGYAAGIYTGDVVGAPSSSGIICDDFNDTVTSGEKWNAKAFQVSTLVSSGNLDNTLFGKSIGVTGYAEVATLVSMMFSGSKTYGSIGGITQAEIASAIWDITTPGGIKGLNATALSLVNAIEKAFNGKTTAATNYLASLTNLWILTPATLGKGEPQEMWTEGLSMAEGGAPLMYLALAMLFCGWAFFRRTRDRISS